MADLGQLEKMGRELKCPICLSLLGSAVSLLCNHVFCNSCILKTMKATSCCPVCKVPFRRREIRAAPHMDNLVSIYKTMEAAAGVNIHTSQTATMVQNSGEKSCKQDKKQFKSVPKRKGRTPRASCHAQSSNSNMSAVPSIPAKKRVHVTPYPNSETPLRPEKIFKLQAKSVNFDVNKESDFDVQHENNKTSVTEEKTVVTNYNNVFPPFFWLREDANENDEEAGRGSSQQTMDTETPTPLAPCFSDLKDSDEEVEKEDHVAQVFDSELFEWTQRPCSPELCSTPIKDKVLDNCGEEANVIEENFEIMEILPENKVKGEFQLGSVGNQSRDTKKNRRVRKKSKRKLKQCTLVVNDTCENDSIKDANEAKDAPSDSSPLDVTDAIKTKDSGKKRSNIRKPLSCRFKRKYMKTLKNQFDAVVETDQLEQNKACSGDKSSSVKTKDGIDESTAQIDVISPDSCGGTLKPSLERPDIELSPRPQSENIEAIVSVGGRSSNVMKKGKKKKDTQVITSDRNRRTSLQKRGKDKAYPPENNTKGTSQDGDNLEKVIAENEELQKSTNVNEDLGATSIQKEISPENTMKSIGESHISKINWLKKCNKTSQIICAFCKSSQVTEVSGEMMHYLKCKPVPSDYNGGINLVHSHKHCTEWAPNVYFESENAVNLTDELARSKRIKCSCCGINGAALGCYEKSCRKSFHFTCAKLIPQCRWDMENFVMLCPLHSTCKLPAEASSSNKPMKRKRNSKSAPQHQTTNTHVTSTSASWRWPLGSPCKWLLCCSALDPSEKEIVMEFTKLTGITVSKVWTPSVTHIIASTDENGACKRTLKVMMGIIEGKWILKIDWLRTCIQKMEPVEEEQFEISIDNHGISNGPRQGRLRAIAKKPKLFCGINFYFMGDFTASYKGHLQELVTAAGGTVLNRKPIPSNNDNSTLKTYVIYSRELTENPKNIEGNRLFVKRENEAKIVAGNSGAIVAANTWLLDSIACCAFLNQQE